MLIFPNTLRQFSQILISRLKPKVEIRRCDLTSHPEVSEKYVAVLAEQKSIFPWYRWKEVIKTEENNNQGFAVFIQCPKLDWVLIRTLKEDSEIHLWRSRL